MTTDVMPADVAAAEIVDIDLPAARVLPLASPALTQWILTAIEDLQQQSGRGVGGNQREGHVDGDRWRAGAAGRARSDRASLHLTRRARPRDRPKWRLFVASARLGDSRCCACEGQAVLRPSQANKRCETTASVHDSFGREAAPDAFVLVAPSVAGDS